MAALHSNIKALRSKVEVGDIRIQCQINAEVPLDTVRTSQVCRDPRLHNKKKVEVNVCISLANTDKSNSQEKLLILTCHRTVSWPRFFPFPFPAYCDLHCSL